MHLLAALAAQQDEGPRRCWRAPACTFTALQTALDAAITRLPQVQGTDDNVQVGRELGQLLNQATEKEAHKRNDPFIASELFLLAVADDKGEAGRHRAMSTACRASRSKARSTRCAAARACTAPTPKASARR